MPAGQCVDRLCCFLAFVRVVIYRSRSPDPPGLSLQSRRRRSYAAADRQLCAESHLDARWHGHYLCVGQEWSQQPLLDFSGWPDAANYDRAADGRFVMIRKTGQSVRQEIRIDLTGSQCSRRASRQSSTLGGTLDFHDLAASGTANATKCSPPPSRPAPPAARRFIAERRVHFDPPDDQQRLCLRLHPGLGDDVDDAAGFLLR